ncbi:MAG: tetratricopeptide repeat protein, partial [Bdellovibrionota bacterium]
MKILYIITFLTALFLVIPCSMAGEGPGAKIYEQFNQGAYFQAIDLLSDLEQKKQSAHPTVWYWKAICYQKLQDHKEANHFFEKAIGTGVFPKEIYYQYGQSLFADNNVSEARKYFNKSWQSGIKPGHSLFYIAYTYQLDNQYEDAIKYYKQLNQLGKIDPN